MRSLMLMVLAMPVWAAGLGAPVKVDGGLVQGVAGDREAGVTVFRGVPFAAPPVGAARWRAPGPVKSWDGVRKADQFGASCIQNIRHELKPWTYEFMTHNEISEDCLFLNVWTGAKSSSERRPVFVYIYGGGFNSGSGQVPVYDGESLARQGVIVVSMNYRVGPLGFLAHPELTTESDRRASGNYGLLDQIAALEWIQRNIAAFGGDRRRVTIAGQSAGAASVHFLTASPLAKGLFHRAIAQSGSGIGRATGDTKLADAEAEGVKWAQAKGAKSLAELRALSWEKVQEPVRDVRAGFRPIADGWSLKASSVEVFARGEQNDVVTITGANRDENGAVPNPDVTAEAFVKQARSRWGADADELLRLYPAGSDAEARAAANDSARDLVRVSMYLWARQRGKTAKTPAFTYYWTHPLPGDEIAKYGAFHTSEVPYVFDALAMSKRPFVDADRVIARKMSGYWVNFVKNGDPNGKGLARWAPVGDRRETMEVGDRFGALAVAGSDEKFKFWERVLSR